MKVSSLHTQRLQIPLRARFEQSNSSATHSDSAVVEIFTSNRYSGYGESCPRPYVTGEDYSSVSDAIQSTVPWLKKLPFESIADIRKCVMDALLFHIGPAAVCALELALLDAWSKENNTSIARALSIALPERVIYSGVVPLRSPEGTAQVMQLMRHFKFRELKLKIDTDLVANLARIGAIREVFPESVPLRVDVNCAWSWDDAMLQIPALLQQGINVFEQVFPPDQDESMARLQQHFGDSICLMADESLTTLSSAQRLVQMNACRRFNLKISKHGGLFNTLRIYKLARENGISCQLGAHFGETCILTAAGIIFAGMAGDLTAVEGGLGTHLLEYDLGEALFQIDTDAIIANPAALLAAQGWGIKGQDNSK